MMKSLKEIKEELIRDGAVVRLSELNKEREILLRIIKGVKEHDEKKAVEITEFISENKKKPKKKFKSWTQTPEGRERMRQVMIARHKRGEFKGKKKGTNGRPHSSVH